MKHITLFAAALAVSISTSAQIEDGSFEAGIGAGTWTEASVTYGTPLCDAGCGTCGGPCAPNTGAIYAWFGGAGDAAEVGSLTQDAFIPAGATGAIEMFVKIAGVGDGTANNYLRVLVDGTEVGRITAEDSTMYSDYMMWSVNVDDYTDGEMHTIMIEGKENGTAVFNVLVDDVVLVVDGEDIVGLFENQNLAGVSIYPNPASDMINFAFNNVSGAAVVNVSDVSGKLVISNTLSEVSGRTFQLATSDLDNGIYMVTVRQGQKQFTERVMIAH